MSLSLVQSMSFLIQVCSISSLHRAQGRGASGWVGVCLLAMANLPQSSKPQKEQYRSKRDWRHRQCPKSLKWQLAKKRHPSDPMKRTMAYTKEEVGKPKPRRQWSLPVRLRMKISLTPNLMITLILNMWTRHKPHFSDFLYHVVG